MKEKEKEEEWEGKVVEVLLFPVEVVVLEEEAKKLETLSEPPRKVQSRRRKPFDLSDAQVPMQ